MYERFAMKRVQSSAGLRPSASELSPAIFFVVSSNKYHFLARQARQKLGASLIRELSPAVLAGIQEIADQSNNLRPVRRDCLRKSLVAAFATMKVSHGENIHVQCHTEIILPGASGSVCFAMHARNP
jgi:hypothetical protein